MLSYNAQVALVFIVVNLLIVGVFFTGWWLGNRRR
jgi:hypothetical protein